MTAPENPPKGDRIAKLLARAGIASRREVERMIADGRVKILEQVVTTPATVLESLRGVTVDDVPVRAAEAPRLFAFHKPAGLITAERDPAGRPTIYTALRNALPPGSPRLMPVGRLDLSTEGLLLMTNDGELKRAMELPSSLVPRTYRARTYGDISQDQLEALSQGIEIEGIRYGSINANMERRTGRNQWIEMTLTEGKNREVRRVLEYLGLQVSRLLRVAYGPFLLGDLPRGLAVEIPQVQVERFRKGGRHDPVPVPMPGAPVRKRREEPREERPVRAVAPARAPFAPPRRERSADQAPEPRPEPRRVKAPLRRKPEDRMELVDRPRRNSAPAVVRRKPEDRRELVDRPRRAAPAPSAPTATPRPVKPKTGWAKAKPSGGKGPRKGPRK